MAGTLHAQLLEQLQQYENDATGFGPVLTLTGALRVVLELAHESQAPAVGGGFCDVDTIRPSELLQAIADALGVTDQERIEKEEQGG